MNWDIIEGNWNQLKGRLKERWGDFTDDELDVLNGKRDLIAGKLQEKYGIARDQAERELDDWASRYSDFANRQGS